jgi:hypothetical protein
MKTLRQFWREFEVFGLIDYVRMLRALRTFDRRRRIAARAEIGAAGQRAAECEAWMHPLPGDPR